ncbi:efflux transporter outer membrane subunit [Novosphingobium sp. 1949]|uniref:Efflux transporter outer membrane subunit n=1 Tax=Novosphingobium organovorum TaxID=2930092 RepID=A0ABT0BDA4_9SPHN|nr:efflux transporter outer membrane subunit [Novosphingobium organovorum]MCJ2182963.1 efflux transporter outer membrane subunit [Novosphingobium organovorum]
MSQLRSFVALGALGLALAGCATAGPDYAPPEHAVANAPSAQGAFVSGQDPAYAQAPLPDDWWKLYNDPRLDTLVEEALAANADLRVAEANILKSRGVVREEAGAEGLNTGIGAAVTQERNYSLRSAGTNLPGVLTGELGLNFDYPLDLHGKIKRAIEASLADHEAVEAARDAVRIAVVAATTKAYADVCVTNYQIATVEKVIALQQKTLDATMRLQKGGRGTAFDVSRARTAVEGSRASLPGYYARRQASLYRLATLRGKPPADYPRDVESCATLPTLSQPMPIGDGAALIRRRPDIRQAERRIAADTARIGVATADLYPSISIAGGIMGFNQVKNLPKEEALGFGIGPLLSWSWPFNRQVHARIDQANAQVKSDLATFDATVLEALRTTETALETYARDREKEQALGKAAGSAGLSAEQAGKLFRFGRSDFLSLLSAQSALANAQVSHAAAKAALVDDQIAVFLELGGGWQQPKAAQEGGPVGAAQGAASPDKPEG